MFFGLLSFSALLQSQQQAVCTASQILKNLFCSHLFVQVTSTWLPMAPCTLDVTHDATPKIEPGPILLLVACSVYRTVVTTGFVHPNLLRFSRCVWCAWGLFLFANSTVCWFAFTTCPLLLTAAAAAAGGGNGGASSTTVRVLVPVRQSLLQVQISSSFSSRHIVRLAP